MPIQARRDYLAVLWQRYQGAAQKTKSRILDEIEENLGVHRKSAIRLMRHKDGPPALRRGRGGGRRGGYSEKARKHLKALYPKMGHMGASRMKAALSDWLPHYDDPDCTEDVRAELLAMSTSTIERILKGQKAKFRRQMNTGTKRSKSKVTTHIPLRQLGARPTEIGHCEIDTVAHCGDSMSGTFAWTLSVTDMLSGHTEYEAIWGKTGTRVRAALGRIESRLPFPLRALYFDNGNEMVNMDMLNFVREAERLFEIELYRGRPYRKNDQCFVEQKNLHVRELFGYERLDWKLAVQLMNNIYRGEWRLLQNHFHPQIKVIEKQRIGSQQKRKLSTPKTPFVRLMEAGMPRDPRQALVDEHESLNPFNLREKLKKKLRDFRLYQGKDASLSRHAI